MVQLILSAFEAHREEKKIAQKIRAEFDKNHGKFHFPRSLDRHPNYTAQKM